ncbi:hypothetical protein HPB49_025284 [Dermacentor silvarum]|uniref:Uncharacterized protein n=1 Tax=Dermacentor silvarum TaxID=543639 RepID=A0ACB8D908_DERSI|nr:hypothetical protein HPB49_025284 [Dermacentor silvarum]
MRCVPEKSKVIRVLGGGIYKGPEDHGNQEEQNNLKACHTFQTLRSATKRISRIVKRITRRRKGMRDEMLRLVHQVISRMTYEPPISYHYHSLKKRDQSKSMPSSEAHTNLPWKLAALEMHNTFAELSDVVMASQKSRLQNTAAARASSTGPERQRSFVPSMGNDHSRPRSEERPRQRQQFKGDPYETHVDVAAYPTGGRFAVAAVNGRDNSLILAASVRAETPAAAETIAAALVIKQNDRKNQRRQAGRAGGSRHEVLSRTGPGYAPVDFFENDAEHHMQLVEKLRASRAMQQKLAVEMRGLREATTLIATTLRQLVAALAHGLRERSQP